MSLLYLVTDQLIYCCFAFFINTSNRLGAGVSAESGIPTFRGAGGFWRKYQATDLATNSAFMKNPSLVWEFYHYRRELVLTKQPNAVSLTSRKNP